MARPSIPTTEVQFVELFERTPRDSRFEYKLNKPIISSMFLFTAVFLGAMAMFWSETQPSTSIAVAMMATGAVCVIGVFTIIFLWRTFARRSAVVLMDDALVWMDKTEVHHLLWDDLTAQRFGKALEGASSNHGTLRFGSSSDSKALTIYTPYMRVNHSALTLGILLRIKELDSDIGDTKES